MPLTPQIPHLTSFYDRLYGIMFHCRYSKHISVLADPREVCDDCLVKYNAVGRELLADVMATFGPSPVDLRFAANIIRSTAEEFGYNGMNGQMYALNRAADVISPKNSTSGDEE